MKLYLLKRPITEREVPMEIGTCDQLLRLLSEIMECHPDRTADLMRRADSVLDERLRLAGERDQFQRFVERLMPGIFGGRERMSLGEVIQRLECLGLPEGAVDGVIEAIEKVPGVSTDDDMNFTWRRPVAENCTLKTRKLIP